MDDRESTTVNPTTNEEPKLRQWVTPKFEREELRKALGGFVPYSTDSPYHAS